MSSVVRSLLLAACLATGGTSLCGAADVQAGLDAYRRQDYATALRQWAPLADAGDPLAQLNLAYLHARGLGVEQDHARAAELFLQAAEAGDARAQHEIGNAYRTGRGVAQDPKLSTYWFGRAAAQGLADAQFSLGTSHELGLGVPVDLPAAVEWYRRAALQGQESAQTQLGILLSKSPESEVTHYREAVHWLQMGVDRGDLQAKERLGWIYAHGAGVEKDYSRAIALLEEPALGGDSSAQFELGLIYELGAGFRNLPEARKWYEMAAERRFFLAPQRLLYDSRLRAAHIRQARIHEWDGPGTPRVPDPDELRRGPDAPVALGFTDEVFCDFYSRVNHGGNPKFRCFMMTGPRMQGGHYYDDAGRVHEAADGVLVLDTERGPRPVLAIDDGSGGLKPLTYRDGFSRRFVAPLELKVKYRSSEQPDLVFHRDMYSEVAATRLLWALSFPADRMYLVRRVHCHRCPREPFKELVPLAEGQSTTFEDVAVELRYRAGQAEIYDAWLEGGWSWGEELHVPRYGEGRDGFSEQQKKHLDGLVVAMNLVGHLTTPPEQNRLVCIRGRIQQLGPYKLCPETVLLIHDLGATFGKRELASLAGWSAQPVWANPATCEATLPAKTFNQHKVERYVIGKAGHEFILALLDQLTDEHLRALFESAGFERFDLTLLADEAAGPERSSRVIDAWVAAFRDRIRQVQAVTCEGP